MAPFDGTLEIEATPAKAKKAAKKAAKADLVSKQFLDAADLIEKRGLAKCILVTEDGRLCTIGALYQAALGTTDVSRMTVTEYMGLEKNHRAWTERLGFRHVSQVCAWNNDTSTTKEHVVARLRTAACG